MITSLFTCDYCVSLSLPIGGNIVATVISRFPHNRNLMWPWVDFIHCIDWAADLWTCAFPCRFELVVVDLIRFDTIFQFEHTSRLILFKMKWCRLVSCITSQLVHMPTFFFSYRNGQKLNWLFRWNKYCGCRFLYISEIHCPTQCTMHFIHQTLIIFYNLLSSQHYDFFF